jgi:hypothetical protein
MNPTQPSSTIYIAELLQNIAQHIPWSTLANFLNLPDPAPGVVPRELCRCISHHLLRFIPFHGHHEFFRTLKCCGAVITSSFVRCLLLEGDNDPEAFKRGVSNLNIVVECYSVEPIASVLKDYGYLRLEGCVSPHFKAVSHSFTRFLKDFKLQEEVCILIRIFGDYLSLTYLLTP